MKTKLAVTGGATQTFVDDVFSTYLYTGTGAAQTITNGIDLAGKGGLTWIKARNSNNSGVTIDTARGATKLLFTISTGAQGTYADTLTSFNSNGFSLGTDSTVGLVNWSGTSYASWTFRKAAKFFDVVTYTGNGVDGRQIPHSLGVAPGFILIKCTSTGGGGREWLASHKDTWSTGYMFLNLTDSNGGGQILTGNSTSITLGGSGWSVINGTGETYVAYIFAHDTSSTGIIQCGSYTTTGADQQISLGWEPQFLLVKNTNIDFNAYTGWGMFDVMRGMTVETDNPLLANSSTAENGTYNQNSLNYINPTATGFTVKSGTTLAGAGSTGNTYIYMAIRMPNKPPTTGTQVYSPVIYTGNGSYPRSITGAGFPPDMTINDARGGVGAVGQVFDKLRGAGKQLQTTNTGSEANQGDDNTFMMDGVIATATGASNESGRPYIYWLFKRAPGFFDEVCYTGTGVNATQAHNLTVVPEMMIIKCRTMDYNWIVYTKPVGATAALFLQSTSAAYVYNEYFNNTEPTSSVFTVGIQPTVNESTKPYVAYLFATLAGISKVGSYTGNGSTGQAIACGFSGGARFVLIKRTDSTGGWYIFDSTRGLTSGSSPYLLLNSTAAEVTGNNGVYASTGGFTLGATASTTTNISGASYIFLAVS